MRSEHPIDELRMLLAEPCPELRVVAPVVEDLDTSSTPDTKRAPRREPLIVESLK
jgi:hypothetical protein